MNVLKERAQQLTTDPEEYEESLNFILQDIDEHYHEVDVSIHQTVQALGKITQAQVEKMLGDMLGDGITTAAGLKGIGKIKSLIKEANVLRGAEAIVTIRFIRG